MLERKLNSGDRFNPSKPGAAAIETAHCFLQSIVHLNSPAICIK
jgi:hypothetical protein